MNNNGTLSLPKHEPFTMKNISTILNKLPIIQETPLHPEVFVFRDYLDSIQNEPDPVMIMGSFVYARELTLLAGVTNVGKSTLAAQIGISVSKGISCLGMANQLPASTVIYYDFESKKHQLKKRYGRLNLDDNRNFLFCNDVELLDDSKKLFNAIESHIKHFDPALIIVDNMGILNEKSTVDQQAALQVMKSLNRLCKLYNIGIIVVNHTTKIKEPRPLTIYDIEGSAKIANYADAAFFINKTKDTGQRYLKQVKGRNAENPEEVTVIETSEENYFHFEYVGQDEEEKVLPIKDTGQAKNETFDLELIQDIVGMGIMPADFLYKYKNSIGKSERTAERHKYKLIEKGILTKHPDGKLIFNTEFAEVDEGF